MEEPDAQTAALNFQKMCEITHEDYCRVFSMMDADKAGYVNLEEFIEGCLHANGSASGFDMVLLMNETKRVNKQLLLSMNFVEERFNEMLYYVDAKPNAQFGKVLSEVKPFIDRSHAV